MNVATPTQPGGSAYANPFDETWVQEFRLSVARVLATHCDSLALHAFIDGKSSLDRMLWEKAADLGWLAAALPEAHGGSGLGALALQVLHAELGRRAVPGPFVATLSAAQWLSEVADEDLQAEWLPKLASGQTTAAVPAVLASGAGLARSGDAVSGQIDMLGSNHAGLIVAPVGGLGAVEGWAILRPDAARATLRARETWDRTRQLCTLELTAAHADAIIPDAEGLVGRRLQRHLGLALAADSVGGGANISHQTAEYLKSRVQFDKPIASFQAIKHRVADLVASVATQERLLDQAVESTIQDSPDADMWAALSKAGATEAFAFISGDCIQLHGGVGHTWEFDPHIYAKRARLNEALLSDNRTARDFAADALAQATRAGRITTELGL